MTGVLAALNARLSSLEYRPKPHKLGTVRDLMTAVPKNRDLVREWNGMYPEDSYEQGTDRFWRDHPRIRKTIAHGPPYRW